MAVAERRITRPEAPEAALTTCFQVLAKAGFTNVQANPQSMSVSADRKAAGQYTRTPISVRVSASGEGSEITVRSEQKAHSLLSAASRPADRAVTRFLDALDQAPPGARPPPPPPPPSEEARSVPPSNADHLQQLERLHVLLKAGALTQAEFEAEKTKLLGST